MQIIKINKAHKKYRICTLFAYIDDIHAIKDPGMIPYFLSKFGDYEVTIPIWSNRSYPTWKAYFPNAEFPVIEWADYKEEQRHRLTQWICKNAISASIRIYGKTNKI